jgi:hypothetical protein
MPDETDPQDPMTALAAATASVHELYLAYQHAGFTQPEALYLIGVLLTAILRGPSRPPD